MKMKGKHYPLRTTNAPLLLLLITDENPGLWSSQFPNRGQSWSSPSIQAATAPASITIHAISRVITTVGARSLTLRPVLQWNGCYLFPSLDLLQKCKQQRLAPQLPMESE
ncbi:Interleukin-1 Receptor-Associated Kinase 1-Binding Protein 1 [Manis pentadactyla]|nr:Interleukin-1 Receptor-Associated Kinase 1-Binding Protein 1 [Manis pentadactyla]